MTVAELKRLLADIPDDFEVWAGTEHDTGLLYKVRVEKEAHLIDLKGEGC